LSYITRSTHETLLQRKIGAFILLWVFFVEEGRLQDAGEEDDLVACRRVVSVDGRRSSCPAAAATATTDYLIACVSMRRDDAMDIESTMLNNE